MAKKGDLVKFGKYYQTSKDKKDDIEWIVLDVKNDRALLLSKLVLDAKPYNDVQEDITWENCTLRKWLNDSFLKTAFSSEEEANIIDSILANSDNSSPLRMKVPDWMKQYDLFGKTVPGGNETTDKVFLLSWEEAIQYFPEASDSKRKLSQVAASVARYQPENILDVARILSGITAKGTEYARRHNLDDCGGCPTLWFRSPGNTSAMAVVTMFDDILYRPGCEVDDETNGVRPAMWVSKSAVLTTEELEEIKKQKEEAEKRRQELEKKKQAETWRKQGLCQYCGGQIKGLFNKKCSVCGRKKDY